MGYEVIRTHTETPEVIERADGNKTISGYAVLWYDGTPQTEYPLPDGRIERIKREDFEPVLSLGGITALRLNHSKDCELDNTGATLVLRSDSKGIRFDSPYDPTDPDHNKVMSKFRKKQIKGCSFRAIGRHSYEKDGNKTIAWLTNVARLTDVSIVGGNVDDRPAYKGTEVMIRTEQDEFQDWQKQEQAKKETEKRIERLNKIV